MKIGFLPLLIILSLSFISISKDITVIDKTQVHLDTYAKYNATQHDNIDDTPQTHGHTHKHSDNGEEHEHNHEHIKVNQYEVKLVDFSKGIKLPFKEFKQEKYYREKNLSSSSHPLELFRPPIS